MPTRPSATDRLSQLYRTPGPYLSVIVAAGEVADEPPETVFAQARTQLNAAGASDAALDAVAARLALPRSDDVGAVAVYATPDGTTVADAAHEPPRAPLVRLDTLPYAAPLLEWDQWRVPHLAITCDDHRCEVISFVPGLEPDIHAAGPPDQVAVKCRQLARAEGIELIVVGGEPDTAARVRASVADTVPLESEVQLVDEPSTDAFADAVVRAVSDRVARETVAWLREFRFLAEHGAAVQGHDDVFAALADGRGGRLLVHDDPSDDRRARFGARPTQVGALAEVSMSQEGRLVDVAIWSAIGQGLPIRIAPSTAERGPDDDIALLRPEQTLELDEDDRAWTGG